MSTALSTMAGKLAARLGMDAGTDLMNTLKNTAFKGGNVTDEQFTALLIVANQYGLNPWTKEIYAFPDKGGIVPVVGVDGWARIINEHPQFDGKRNTQPWQSHPTRMLRHKTLIQCARLAFGFAGIFDQDEAERVIEGTTAEVHAGHESDSRRTDLIAKGESAARLGTVKYQEFWVALSAEEKQVIGAVEKRRMYDMSLAVDNAEPVHVADAEAE